MKVTQIIAESTKKPVSEAPAGALGQFGKKVLAKTAAKVGAKNFAAGVAGNVDTGAEANELRKNWQAHQGSIGGKMGANDPAEFKQWLLNNGFKGKDKVIDKAMADNKIEGPFGKGPLDKALLQIVQDSKKASAGAEEQPKDQKGKVDQQGSTKPTTPTPTPAPGPQNTTATELDADIKRQLDQATKGEKNYALTKLGSGEKPPAPKPSAEVPGKETAPKTNTPPKPNTTGAETPQNQPKPVTKTVTSKAAQNNTKTKLKTGTPDNPVNAPAVQGTT